jgi:hypothetical protein
MGTCRISKLRVYERSISESLGFTLRCHESVRLIDGSRQEISDRLECLEFSQEGQQSIPDDLAHLIPNPFIRNVAIGRRFELPPPVKA